jgi:hypothetical protein
MGISSHRLPSGGGGASEGFHRLATGGYGRQVATGDDEHWDRALSLAPNCPPAGPPIDAQLGTIRDHHEIDETNEMTGGDGMCYSTEYPRQDSNLRPQL